MHRHLVAIFLLTFSCSSHGDWEFAVGGGLQYGGVFGVQAGYRIGNSKLNFSAGAVGLGLGIEQLVGSRVSVGYQGVVVAAVEGHGIFLNYLIPKDGGSMWKLGIDYLLRTELLLNQSSSRDDIVLVSMGYRF